MGGTQSVANKLRSATPLAGVAVLKSQYTNKSLFNDSVDLWRVTFQILAGLLAPNHRNQSTKAAIIGELGFLANPLPGLDPKSTYFGEPLTNYIARPLVLSTQDNDLFVRGRALDLLEKLTKAGLLGEIAPFTLPHIAFYRGSRDEPLESRVSKLQSVLAAGRSVQRWRDIVFESLLLKLTSEKHVRMQSLIVEEINWILVNNWYELTDKDHALQLYYALLDLMVLYQHDDPEPLVEATYSCLCHVILKTKLPPEIIGIAVKTVCQNLEKSNHHLRFVYLNLLVLHYSLNHCTENSNCARELMLSVEISFVAIGKLAEDFHLTDQDVMTYTVALQIVDKALGIARLLPALSQWSPAFHKAVISLLGYSYLLGREELMSTANQCLARLFQWVNLAILFELSSFIMLLLVPFLHPKRIADLAGYTTDLALPSVRAELEALFLPSALSESANQAAIPSSSLDQDPLSTRRTEERLLMNSPQKNMAFKLRTRELLAYLKDYDVFEALNKPTTDQELALAASMVALPTMVQIQAHPLIIRQLFAQLNLLQTGIYSLILFGLQLPSQNPTNMENVLRIFSDRLAAPCVFLLSDLWNKVLSHLVLVFGGNRQQPAFAASNPQEMTELQRRLVATNQRLDQLSALKASTDQQVKELEAQTKELKKQNEHVTQTFSCAICFENLLENNPVVLDCGHLFCQKCISDLKGSRHESVCVLCQRPFTKVISIKGA